MTWAFFLKAPLDSRSPGPGEGAGLGLAMAKAFASCGAKVMIAGRSRSGSKRQSPRSPVPRAKAVRPISSPPTCASRSRSRPSSPTPSSASGRWTASSTTRPAISSCPPKTSRPTDSTPSCTVLHGSVCCTLEVGRHLAPAQAPGAIVSIVTTYAWTGTAFALPSACAKAGVLAMTRSLAVEWGHAGIRLNAIAPGPIPTEGAFSRLMPNKQAKSAASAGSLGRFGTKRDREPRDVPSVRPLPVPDGRLRHDGRRRVARRRRRVLGLSQGPSRRLPGRPGGDETQKALALRPDRCSPHSRPGIAPASLRPARGARGFCQTRRSGRGRPPSYGEGKIAAGAPSSLPSGRRAKFPGSQCRDCRDSPQLVRQDAGGQRARFPEGGWRGRTRAAGSRSLTLGTPA